VKAAPDPVGHPRSGAKRCMKDPLGRLVFIPDSLSMPTFGYLFPLSLLMCLEKDLFAFIHVVDLIKIKVVERERAC
nr:hypothetical protein [Tanacetum cinerariifolium]